MQQSGSPSPTRTGRELKRGKSKKKRGKSRESPQRDREQPQPQQEAASPSPPPPATAPSSPRGDTAGAPGRELSRRREQPPLAIAEAMHMQGDLGRHRQAIESLFSTVQEARGEIAETASRLAECTTQTQLDAALTFKADSSEMRRLLAQATAKMSEQMALKADRDAITRSLQGKVAVGDFQELSDRVLELRATLDAKAGGLFSDFAVTIERMMAGKANTGTMEVALRSKADFLEVRQMTERLESLESAYTKLNEVQRQQANDLQSSVAGQLANSVSELSSHRDGLQSQMAAAGEALKSQRNELRGMAKLLVQEQGKTAQLSQQNQTLAQQVVMLRKQGAEQAQAIAQMQAQLAQVETAVVQNATSVQDLGARFEESQGASEQAVADLQHSSDFMKSELQTLKQRLHDRTVALQQDWAGLRDNHEALSRQCDELTGAQDVLHQASQSHADQLRDLGGPVMDAVRNLRQDSDRVSAELERHQRHYRDILSDYAELLEDVKQLKESGGMQPALPMMTPPSTTSSSRGDSAGGPRRGSLLTRPPSSRDGSAAAAGNPITASRRLSVAQRRRSMADVDAMAAAQAATAAAAAAQAAASAPKTRGLKTAPAGARRMSSQGPVDLNLGQALNDIVNAPSSLVPSAASPRGRRGSVL